MSKTDSAYPASSPRANSASCEMLRLFELELKFSVQTNAASELILSKTALIRSFIPTNIFPQFSCTAFVRYL